MNRSLLILMLIVVCLYSSGQQISHSTNHYRNGDMLEKRQVKVEGFDLNGKNGVWSLEDAEISKKSYIAEYTANADSMMVLERGNKSHFKAK